MRCSVDGGMPQQLSQRTRLLTITALAHGRQDGLVVQVHVATAPAKNAISISTAIIIVDVSFAGTGRTERVTSRVAERI